MDLGSVHKLAGDETSGAGQFILEPGRERKLASGGEGGPVGLKLDN